jgi:DNA polymerase-3 subunit alpha
MVDFIHLHTHTSLGSMADSMVNVYKLFEKSKEFNQNAIAITDHGTLASILDARKASKKTGVKYIPGLEAYFVRSIEERVEIEQAKGKKQKKDKRNHLILLAKNEIGYKNLLSINYEGFSKFEYVPILGKVFPVIDWNTLERFNEGVVCLSACGSGPLAAEMFKCNEEGEWDKDICHVNVIKMASRFKSIFGNDFYLELQPHNLFKINIDRKTKKEIRDINGEQLIIVDQTYINRKLLAVSRELDIPIVATCDVHYLEKEDAKIHDMLMAINEKKPLNDLDRHKYDIEEFYLKTGDEVFKYFENLFDKNIADELCRNTIEISNKCKDSSYIDSSDIRFPLFDVKNASDYQQFLEWKESQKFNGEIPIDHAYMRFKCINAFVKKFGDLKPSVRKIYKDRMIEEVKVYEL